MPLQDKDWVIDDGNWTQFVDNIDPKTQGMGLIPRDFSAEPTGFFEYAPEFPDSLLVPRDRQESLLKEQKAAKASLLFLREDKYDYLKSLYQKSEPLCWAFSTTKSVMYYLASGNAPESNTNVRLSAWWVAGKVYNWSSRGGWNIKSLEQVVKAGVPSEAVCPEFSRRYDTTEVAEDAMTRKVTEWFDGSDNAEKATQQMISILLLGGSCMVDLPWMRHSMCAMNLESINPLIVDCDNSWGENNGNKGLYRLVGSRAVPSGGLAMPRVVTRR